MSENSETATSSSVFSGIDFSKLNSDIIQSATSLTDQINKDIEQLSLTTTGKSISENAAILADQAKECGDKLNKNFELLAKDVHSNLDEFTKIQTGDSLASHQESITKMFVNLGNEGSTALGIGILDQSICASQESLQKLIALLEYSAPQLSAVGPSIISALSLNDAILKKITQMLVNNDSKGPENLGIVLGEMVNNKIVPKEAVDEVLDKMKTLHLADDKGLKKEEVLSLFTKIASFMAGPIGGAVAGSLAKTIAKNA